MSQEMGGKNRLWRSALFSQLTVSFKARSTLVNGKLNASHSQRLSYYTRLGESKIGA